MQPRQSTPIRAPTLDLTPEQIARHRALITKAAGPVVNIKAQRAHTEIQRQAAAGVGTALDQALKAAEEASRKQQAHLSASVTKRDDPTEPAAPARPAGRKQALRARLVQVRTRCATRGRPCRLHPGG